MDTDARVELRQLRAFVAVAEELNFGRAAQRLYVTQPALSRTIRALEKLVGCDLFHRNTRSVNLTSAGTALLEHARDVLDGLDAGLTAARAAGGENVTVEPALAPTEVDLPIGAPEVAELFGHFARLLHRAHTARVVRDDVTVDEVMALFAGAFAASRG
ncbi:LysR family transcriptional regulator [Nocardia sp. CDC153]|uniref:LysR family transcriptional regulator n=1 Tax=Nocardia sp. CDC153 TaxID=3112167 RepID=UPI003FA3CEC4